MKIKLNLILPIMLALSSCASNGETPVAEFKKNNPEVITSVRLLDHCPLTGSQEQSLGPSVLLAVLPSLVESSIKGIGEAIKSAGEAKSFVTTGKGTTDFYSFDENVVSLITNPETSCLVVFNAEVGGGAINPEFREDKAFFVAGKTRSGTLNHQFGITKSPKFYFEGSILPSADRSAFQLTPKTIYYGDKIGTKKDVREMVLNIAFGKPNASGEDATFALYTTNVKRGPSTPYHVTLAEILNRHDSKYLPLPAITADTTKRVDLFNTQKSQLKELIEQRRKVDQVLDPQILVLEDNIGKIRKKLESDLIRAKTALENAEKDCLAVPQDAEEACDVSTNESIKVLRRKFKLASKNDELISEKEQFEKTLAQIRNSNATSEKRKNLDASIKNLKRGIGKTRKLLSRSTPVNITATITETTDSNKFLIALGEAISGAAETAKEKVIENLTPEDEDQKIKDNIAELTLLYTARTEAIAAVSAWSVANSEYQSATDDTKSSKETALRLAYYNAKLKCEVVEEYSIVETSCTLLTTPPAIE